MKLFLAILLLGAAGFAGDDIDLRIKTYYTVADVPCAIDRSTVPTLVQSVSDKDTQALQGLEESGKILWLARGTRVEGIDFPVNLFSGAIKSGRNVTKKCYVFKEWLQANPPRKPNTK